MLESSYPSRRTIVKAGLWAAPTLAVVNLTSISAAHASGSGCSTTTPYPSHGILVYTVASAGLSTYYIFKFGDGTSTAPLVVAEQNSNDLKFLTAKYPGVTLIGNGVVGSIWATLQSQITVALFSSGAIQGYIFTGPTTGLVAAFVFDGSTQYLPVQANTSGQYIFTNCK